MTISYSFPVDVCIILLIFDYITWQKFRAYTKSYYSKFTNIAFISIRWQVITWIVRNNGWNTRLFIGVTIWFGHRCFVGI